MINVSQLNNSNLHFRGESGSQDMETTVVIPLGNSSDGVLNKATLATYTWRDVCIPTTFSLIIELIFIDCIHIPEFIIVIITNYRIFLQIPNTNFSICVVVPKADRKIQYLEKIALK